MPLICPACGFGNSDFNNFCESCGGVLSDSGRVAAPDPAPGYTPPTTYGAPPASTGAMDPYGAPAPPPVGGYSAPPPPMPPVMDGGGYGGAGYGGGGYGGSGYGRGGYGGGYGGGGRMGPAPANLSWIGDAWNLIMSDMGEYVGYFFVLVVINLFAAGLIMAPQWGMIIAEIAASSGSSASSSSNFPSMGMGAEALSNALSLLLQIFQGIVLVGVASNLLRKLRFGDPLDIGQTFRDGFSRAVPAGIYTVVASFIVGIGSCCCILPGIWLSAAMQLGYFRLADGSPDFWTAFTDGLAVAQSDVMGYFFLVLITSIVAGLGILACGIGIFWTAPISYLVWALAYRASFDTA